MENPVGLKMRFYQIEPGVIETTYTAPAHYQGYPGMLHGGIIASILDETSGRALTGKRSEPRFMFTAKLEVNYRRTAHGETAEDRRQGGQDRGRSAEGWAGIYNAETGDLLAEGDAILVNVPEEKLAEISDAEELGWRVYPEEQ